MKKSRFILTILLSALFPFLLSAQVFEGKVVYKMIQDDETINMNYFVKEGKIKIDVQGENEGSMIFDSKDNTMLIMMPAQKMYMQMNMNMNSEEIENAKEKENKFRKTGEKKEILGYTCEKWIYKDDESEVESWLTKELGSFIFLSNPQQGSKPAWQSRMESQGYFPIMVITKDDNGKITSHMEVTSVEKQSLSNDMFVPPSDYQKISIPGME
jgi:hypothetical protein